MESGKEIKNRETGGLRLDHLALDEKSNLKKGNALINQLYTAIKAGQLYDPNNEGYISQIDKLMDTLSSLFEREDDISLEVYMHCLFFNRIKVKTEFQNYMHTKFLIDALRKRDTEGLFFTPGLTREELSHFILLFAQKDAEADASFDEFQAQLFRQHIENISIHRFSAATKRAAEERLMGIRRQAKRTFFESIYNLKAIMFKGKSERRIGVRRVRRLVQSVVDLIAEDESYLIGLTTMKNYDTYILNHSVNVCILSVALGQRVGLEKDTLKELGLAGLFHDLGKTPLPQEIHYKNSIMTKEERALLEKHPHYGVEMLMEMKSLRELPVRAMKAILEHHLRFDMSGYPTLTERKEIDLFSRIITIADHFDAVTTPQPSQSRQATSYQVLLKMVEEGGKAFDPILVKLFVNAVGLYPIGSLVALDTGELAVTIQPHAEPAFLDRPVVKLIGDRNGLKDVGETADLAKADPLTGTYTRTIVKCLDPQKYRMDTFAVVAH